MKIEIALEHLAPTELASLAQILSEATEAMEIGEVKASFEQAIEAVIAEAIGNTGAADFVKLLARKS